ncbi:MAG: ribonuclease N [Candidatus Eremiobacteraeota bacterium]|nr:ribonuclease N [Candidatus Eremiobacteraeota bacterium]
MRRLIVCWLLLLLGCAPVAETPPAADPTAPAGMATMSLDRLPPEALKTLELIDAGGPFPYRQDGTVFANREHLLPAHERGYYHEYTVKTPGLSHRGPRRLVTGQEHELYYTGDHYRSFQWVLR